MNKINETGYYTVEKIIGKRKIGTKVQYKVLWQGFS